MTASGFKLQLAVMPDNSKRKIVVIAGPTGVGKSEIAVKVAEQISGEIISADSVQIYRYFDIGSGKPGKEFRDRVPHHLLDILEPDAEYSLWNFREDAQRIISEIFARGNVPILTGGTGLYIRATLEGLEGGVAKSPELRDSLLQNMEEEGTEALYHWLIRLDPKRAAKIHPNDTHRIIRGIENALLPKPENGDNIQASLYDTAYFVLSGAREKVYGKINRRVEEMISRGWIEETASILNRGYSKECKPFLSVGYKQIVRHLEENIPINELISAIQQETRRYAKRQITWFNQSKGAIWIDNVSSMSNSEGITNYISNCYRRL